MNANLVIASLTALFLLILCCFNRYGDAIKCYQCNSAKIYDPNGVCENIAEHADRAKYEKDCADLPAIQGRPYERCRTVVQEVEGETRVIRSCATYPDKTKENRCTDRTGTLKIKMRYCECGEDLCNGVSMLTSSSLMLALLASVALFGICW